MDNNFKIEADWLDKTLIDDNMLKYIKNFAKGLAEEKSFSTTQLRRFFNKLKLIQYDFEKNRKNISKLLPYLAYTVGRFKAKSDSNKNKIEDFYYAYKDVLEYMVKDIDNKNKFNQLVDITEIIVAYHKFYFEKNSKSNT